MALCEIEIKSLLGSRERAKEVLDKLFKLYPDTALVSKNKQLNHYFVDGDLDKLYDLLRPQLIDASKKELRHIIEKGEDFSVRTRLIDAYDPIFVVKASLDEGTSHNTVSRLEFETQIQGLTLSELDQLLLGAGFQYQAKWSREREEYKSCDISICLDKNAGYGYLAEFEKVVDNEDHITDAREELDVIMNNLGVEELSQERLERMFAHYNENWPEYYGTEKIFIIE